MSKNSKTSILKNSFSLRSRIKSFSYALKGLQVLFLEVNFVIHLFIASLVIGLGAFFQVSQTEWLVLVLTIGSVLFAEAINTSIENLVDLVSPDYHELAERCKDVAAMAVLITGITAAAVGLIIFVPYFTMMIRLE